MERAMMHVGDCRDVMVTMAAESIDAVVTDPPYGLSFMGKGWDHGVPGVEFWEAALRVLKPGAHLLAFGGTRTFHRLTCAIEDAGFEIRDCIMWVYGSGFPKSLDVAKAIDRDAGAEREIVGSKFGRPGYREGPLGSNEVYGSGLANGTASCVITAPATEAAREWDGWGTALKPAWEPIIVARKPLAGTVADNVQRFGTGAINVDACRVGTDGGCAGAGAGARVYGDGLNGTFAQPVPGLGRWPANLIHDGSDEVLAAFPDAPGQLAPESFSAPSSKTRNAFGERGRRPGGFGDVGADRGDHLPCGPMYSDAGSAARFFYCAKASRDDRNEGCEGLTARPLNWSSGDQSPGTFQAEGTDRTSPNNHPTVKPSALMRYLCRLVTPPDGLILDPFAGSGSTGKAAMIEDFRFVGIDLDAEHVEIARRRIAHAAARPKQHALALGVA